MSKKHTLGGTKKLVFAPKKPVSENAINNSTLNIDQSTTSTNFNIKKHNISSIKKHKINNKKPSFVPLAPSNKTTDYITPNETKVVSKELSFKDECDPQLLEPNDNKSLGFDEDVMFLFSGEINNGKIVIDDDGECLYNENGKFYSLLPKEMDRMCVVYIDDDDVYEIGNVFSGFVLCKDDL